MFAKPSLIAASLALGLATLVPGKAEAHRRWLLPSQTVFSGDSVTVSVDAAASNELFVADHAALRTDAVTVIGPDGEAVEVTPIGKGRYRSAFDVAMDKQGTYRIAIASDGAMGFYVLDEKRHRMRGDSTAELAEAVPEGASDVRIVQSSQRIETFATLGAPNDTALQPTGKGLELVLGTHPTDLVAEEPATLRFLMDGKPAADMEIELVKGGTRYRDDAGIQMLKTDANGEVSVTVEDAGRYYLEGGMSVEAPAGGYERRASYTAVLEFMPL